MSKFTVRPEGAEINGEQYLPGHEFEFETIPSHIQEAIDDGRLQAESDKGVTTASEGEPEAGEEKKSDEDSSGSSEDDETQS